MQRDRRHISVAVLLGILVLCSAVEVPTASDARVSGVVLDESGRPVPGTRLQLNEAVSARTVNLKLIPATTADSTGHFSFEGCKTGRYLLSSEFSERNYGNTVFEFYRTQPPTLVDIASDNQIIGNLKFVLGPPGGDVRGEIRDRTSGQFVSAHLRMWLVNAPKAFVELGIPYDRFREVVPSDVDFAASIEVKGYKKWMYSGPDNGKNSIRVSPYETKLLGVINLIRDP